MPVSTLEKLVDYKKKELGAFYTPIHVVDYMISLLNNWGKDSNLLEPAGGDGVFVSRVLGKNLLKPKQITVWDINSEVKSLLEKFGVNIQIKDTLLETNFLYNYTSGNQETFSHIIGNPPYLNKQSSYIKKNKNQLRKIYKEIGANDTYAMFLYLCGEILRPNGQLSFIISDTFLSLGIHKKLRKWLLKNFSIKEITLCPDSLFSEFGASVHTSIITILNQKSAEGHFIRFNDCKNNAIGDYNGKIYEIKQNDFLTYPDFVFHYKNNKKLIQKIDVAKKLIDYVDGGLGMHTTDNNEFLGIIDYGNKNTSASSKKIKNVVPVEEIKNGEWKIYHKKGGNNKYYSRPNHCIKWDKKSINNYKGLNGNLKLAETRQGFIISGVCSELSARLMIKNALWESNKAMCFFPKDPGKYPPEFFIGILNSNVYNNILKIFNHTNSIQIRDIKKMPFFGFTRSDVEKITTIAKNIIEQIKRHENYDFVGEQEKINQIVASYI